jgi:hypothetical protein
MNQATERREIQVVNGRTVNNITWREYGLALPNTTYLGSKTAQTDDFSYSWRGRLKHTSYYKPGFTMNQDLQ